ncbi:hypothetical protein H0H81_004523 [Sphagnurus paluster]|uniref:Nucleolar 27S pre-rRNA processing Urb2/Npa2 C-terminal domain-containing protein n=1 Tax=Sphagnurus paluster TaxID=117069 RepID=A0A9P7FXZ0_9AGAR|nr:hypothetical protein H0H81_004523 [Sphagnurus paluster]
MATAQSSRDFVTALKAASDPPTPGGLFKIQIARQAWDNPSFYVPNKAEVIVEWIVSKFLKEREKEIVSNPILDLCFWNLLHDVISSTTSQLLDPHTRPSKTWLPTLLKRIPLAPTLVSLLGAIVDLDATSQSSLCQVVAACLTLIWPLASQKTSTEVLLECFGAFIYAYRQNHEANENLANIGLVVTSSYRNSLWNSSNKKKVYALFLHNYLPGWLECLTQASAEDPYKTVRDTIYDAGAETLFNLDVMRQVRDSRSESTLLDTIGPVFSSNAEICLVLPQLFLSYIENINKYRGALVSQGPSQNPAATGKEIQSYNTQFFASCISLLDTQEQTAHSWSTRVALLNIIDQENLFSLKEDRIQVLLSRITEQAIANLEPGTVKNIFSNSAVECLSTLARIDYDLIIPLVPRIFPKLFYKSQNSDTATLSFLDLVLTYHAKTRTMNAYIETLLAAFSPRQSNSRVSARELYQISLSSPLFNATHLQRLSKATKAFLAGTQALPATQGVFRIVKDAWEEFDLAKPESEEPSPKRRRKDNDFSTPLFSQSDWVILFSLSARIAATILSSLPMSAVAEVTRNEICAVLDEVRSFTHRIVKKVVKAIKKRDRDDPWSLSIALSASLRLQYALDISGQVRSRAFGDDEKILQRMSDILVRKDTLLPELLIELSRFLFHVALKREQVASQLAFDHALTYLEKNIEQPSWSGQVHQLTLEKRDQRQTASALLHMILERWLPVIESFASTKQLQSLVRIITSTNIAESQNNSSGLQAQTLLLQTLGCAQVWELPRFRVAFLEHLNEAVSDLDGAALDSNDPIWISTIVATYRLLLLLPIEYLPRSARAEFARRALVLDTYLTEGSSTQEHLMVPRVFLNRIFLHNHTTDQSMQNLCATLNRIISFEPPTHNHEFISVTTDLIEFIYIDIFKKSEKSPAEELMAVLRTLGEMNTRNEASTLRTESIIRMNQVLESNFKIASFTEQVQASLRELHQKKLAYLYPRISSLEFHVTSSTEVREVQKNVLALWCTVVSFGKWLGVTGNISSLGKQLISKISSQNAGKSPSWDGVCVNAVAILVEEFKFYPEIKRASQLEFILAAYVWGGLIEGPVELRVHTLDFIAQHCNDRPAVLRLGDMDGIWSLLTRLLAGSSAHDRETTPEIFYKIVDIISSLIRLRRDLVTHTLPHLGSVLRQLLMCMRTIRPNLGAKQTSLVTDTQPRWLNAKYPLGVGEVKVLTRLLETLTSKSIVRNNASSVDMQKAESLAKPFSKHAAYVLKAYIKAMNDPLCLLQSEHRKELQRGLYALCSMMNEHSRDALMVGALDAGGKTTMKALWKEYERQRYVGKG